MPNPLGWAPHKLGSSLSQPLGMPLVSSGELRDGKLTWVTIPFDFLHFEVTS